MQKIVHISIHTSYTVIVISISSTKSELFMLHSGLIKFDHFILIFVGLAMPFETEDPITLTGNVGVPTILTEQVVTMCSYLSHHIIDRFPWISK